MHVRLNATLMLLVLVLLSFVSTVPFAQTRQDRQLQRQTQSISTLPSKAKRWALIIGVDQYRDGQINSLRGSVNDAHALANALITYAGFPPDQVIVLTTDKPEERQPTRINVLTYLSNLASLVPKDGLLLFSFAGHGIERGGHAFLIPSDARLSRDISLLEESAVSVTRMHDRIKAIGVGQVIVLLDACRNDPGGRAGAPNNMSAAYTKFNFDVRNREVEAFATLYATAVGQRAYEYTEKKQGYFTWALVDALKGGAANEKGEVTLAALLKYVQENVPKRIAIDLGATEQQRPFAMIEGYRADELVVAVGAPNVPIISNSVNAEPTRIDPAAVEREYWEAIRNSKDAQDYKNYLQTYPNGAYAAIARTKIKQIETNANTHDAQPVTPNSGTGRVDIDWPAVQGWKTLRPGEDGFSVLMPKDPIKESRRSLYRGWAVFRNVYRSATGQRPFFAVMSASGIESKGSEAEKLDSYVDAFRYWLPEAAFGKGAAARLTLVGENSLSGNSGREYQVALAGSSGTARAYFRGGRFFVVVALDVSNDSLTKQFFESFALR